MCGNYLDFIQFPNSKKNSFRGKLYEEIGQSKMLSQLDHSFQCRTLDERENQKVQQMKPIYSSSEQSFYRENCPRFHGSIFSLSVDLGLLKYWVANLSRASLTFELLSLLLSKMAANSDKVITIDCVSIDAKYHQMALISSGT